MGNGTKSGSGGSGKAATIVEDKLSTNERSQIESKLGISADLGGADAYGNDAYLLLEVPDFGEPGFPNTDDSLFPSQTHQPSNAKTTARRLQSFLRLGAFDLSREPATAKKLLKALYAAGPPGYPGREDFTAGALKTAMDAAEAKAEADGVPLSLDNLPDFQTALDAHDARVTAKNGDLAGNRDVFFVDDVRYRPGDVTHLPSGKTATTKDDDPGHGLSMTDRQAESAKLYARGGWRDHSDGNRISTTYGDKVEVVRGNYKMVVMGRQDAPGEAMGWEATGSHIQDYAPGTMPGASYWLQWIPDYQESGDQLVGSKGVWLLANTTENVYEYARNAGNFREEKWGDLDEAYVGSENPSGGQGVSEAAAALIAASPIPLPQPGTQGHSIPEGSEVAGVNYNLPGADAANRHTPPWANDNLGMVRSNPHIVEKTWASRIDSWTGSADCHVPIIDEKKYADSITEHTTCSGTIMGTTHAGAINEREAVGAKAESSISSSIAETMVTGFVLTTGAVLGLEIETKYNLGALTTNLVLGSAIELKLAKESISAELVGNIVDSSVFASKIEVSYGLTVGFKGGATEEFVWGEHNETDMPKKKNTSLAREDMTVDEKHTAINMSDTTVQKEIKALQAKIAAAKVDVGPGG